MHQRDFMAIAISLGRKFGRLQQKHRFTSGDRQYSFGPHRAAFALKAQLALSGAGYDHERYVFQRPRLPLNPFVM